MSDEKKLKSMSEHNTQVRTEHENKSKVSRLNGIACPNCGLELTDLNPSQITRTNSVPYTTVGCQHCAYTGIRDVAASEIKDA